MELEKSSRQRLDPGFCAGLRGSVAQQRKQRVCGPAQISHKSTLPTHQDITAARIQHQMAHAAEIWHQDDATGPRQASGAQRLSRASRVHVVKHRSVTRAICLPSLTRTSQQIPIIPRWPMQLRSGIRMIPQGLDRSQGLRGSAEQAESMWCSTDQSPEHFDYFDLHQDITADTIKAQVAYAAEIWHLDDATGPRQDQAFACCSSPAP